MSQPHSDALVFFGATGDLAYKKIFPALQAMIKRGTLDVPVIGVAKAGWDLDQLKARAKDSLEQHGGLDAGGVGEAEFAAAICRWRLCRSGHVCCGAEGAWLAQSIRRTIWRFRLRCLRRWWSSW